jgi:hypothetical protein
MLLDAQQITPTGQIRIPGIADDVTVFRAKAAARATVERAYPDARPRVVRGAKTREGDSIAGEKIAGFCVDFESLGRGRSAAVRSGGHSRMSYRLKDGAVAIIQATSYGRTLAEDPRKVLEVRPQAESGGMIVGDVPPS